MHVSSMQILVYERVVLDEGEEFHQLISAQRSAAAEYLARARERDLLHWPDA